MTEIRVCLVIVQLILNACCVLSSCDSDYIYMVKLSAVVCEINEQFLC